MVFFNTDPGLKTVFVCVCFHSLCDKVKQHMDLWQGKWVYCLLSGAFETKQKKQPN
eukprot:m.270639 g.270639  ORF g.270639 m.270639 type:complete len:56 (+) comp48678_c0_seq1:214-381(+)